MSDHDDYSYDCRDKKVATEMEHKIQTEKIDIQCLFGGYNLIGVR